MCPQAGKHLYIRAKSMNETAIALKNESKRQTAICNNARADQRRALTRCEVGDAVRYDGIATVAWEKAVAAWVEYEKEVQSEMMLLDIS